MCVCVCVKVWGGFHYKKGHANNDDKWRFGLTTNYETSGILKVIIMVLLGNKLCMQLSFFLIIKRHIV